MNRRWLTNPAGALRSDPALGIRPVVSMRRLAAVFVWIALIEAVPGRTPALAGEQGAGDSMSATSDVAGTLNARQIYRQRVWTREDGLPDDQVLSLLQARDAHLWIGTRKGVARFDGLAFVALRGDDLDELVGGECTALAEDPDGGLWVGTTSGLVHLSAAGNQRFTTQDDLLDDGILSLCRARNGDLWVGTRSGLNRRRDGRFEVIPMPEDGPANHPFTHEVRAIYEDAAGRVWFSNRVGTMRWDPQTDRISEVRVPGFVAFAMQITGDAHTNVWLRSADVLHYSPTRGLASLPDIDLNDRYSSELGTYENVQALLADRAGNLWLGWEGSGLTRYRNGRETGFGADSGLSDTSVNCLLEDREGNLWIGTDSGGLNCWQPRRFTTYTASHGLPDEDTRVVYPARDGGVWIGTERGLALWRDGHLLPHPIPRRLFDTRVRSLYEQTDGALWIGTMDSLERWQDGELTVHRWSEPIDSSRVRVVTADRAGALWVGRQNGLMRWDGADWTRFTMADGLPNNDVRAILEDQGGRLWLGTFGGGLCVLAPDPDFRIEFLLATTNGLADDRVYSLHEDAGGVLWAGTHKGLNRIELRPDPSNAGRTRPHVTVFNWRNGLVENLVNAIAEDDLGNFWIGCDSGIYRVSRNRLGADAAGQSARIECVVYSESDGLPTGRTNGQRSQPAACKTVDGRLWFSTAKGVAVFDPDHVVRTDIAPIIRIDSVTIDDVGRFRLFDASGALPSPRIVTSPLSPLVPAPHLHQSRPKRGHAARMDIRYSAPTFRAPNNVRFRYRLEGWDKDWVEAGAERVARYTNLRPGSYRFQVKAASHFGLWNETPAELAFTVVVPFHEARWFWPACAATLTLLAAAAVRWRVRELKRIHRIERENDLAREREQLARDIHDDLGSGLTRLALLGERVARESRDPAAQASAGRLTGETSHLIDSLDGVVWAADPRQDRLGDVFAFLRERAAAFLEDAGVAAHLDFPSDVPHLAISGQVRRTIYLALAEALSNAVRHGAPSQITVTARLSGPPIPPARSNGPTLLQITVDDNGCGFSAPGPDGPPNPVAGAGPYAAAGEESGRAVEATTPCVGARTRSLRGGGGGRGLSGMRARFEACGGGLEVRSFIGQGTTVVMRVPLKPAPPGATA